MTIAHLKLFKSLKEVVIAFGFISLIFCANIYLSYYNYKNFTTSKHSYKGVVLNAYGKISKKSKPYQVAKISTKDFTIYTTFWKKSSYVKPHEGIEFKIFKKNITFKDYFSKSFYAPIYQIKTKKIENLKHDLEIFIKSQHQNSQIGELYSALFLATSISKDMRNSIQRWGVSHLVAISGFHLGVIYGSLYFLLKIIYGYFQDRFFPYRNIRFDLGIFIFVLLGFYLYLIDFAPSFLRAYVMSFLGLLFYFRHFKVLSFFNLALAVCLILGFFPYLIFSIGFWFSVMGVYFIFLYLHHFSFKWWDTIFINIWVFLALIIPVHVWFGYTSWQQFGATILSIVFIFFYPFAVVLHLINQGGLMDKGLEYFFSISFKGVEIFTPIWVFVSYIILSLASFFSRYLAIFTVSLGLIFFFII